MGHRRQRQPQVPWRFRQRRPRSSSTVRSGAPKSTPPLLVWGGHPCPPPLPSILILRQPTDLATLSFRAIRSRGSDEDARRNLPSVHPCHSDRRRASATASGGTCFCSCQADTPARRLAHLLSSPRSGRRARPIGLRPIPSALQATLTAGAS